MCFIAKMNLPVLAKYLAILVPCSFIHSIGRNPLMGKAVDEADATAHDTARVITIICKARGVTIR